MFFDRWAHVSEEIVNLFMQPVKKQIFQIVVIIIIKNEKDINYYNRL